MSSWSVDLAPSSCGGAPESRRGTNTQSVPGKLAQAGGATTTATECSHSLTTTQVAQPAVPQLKSPGHGGLVAQHERVVAQPVVGSISSRSAPALEGAVVEAELRQQYVVSGTSSCSQETSRSVVGSAPPASHEVPPYQYQGQYQCQYSHQHSEVGAAVADAQAAPAPQQLHMSRTMIPIEQGLASPQNQRAPAAATDFRGNRCP